MTLLPALLALVTAASAGVLDDARAAFATGDYARAERLALEVAEPPSSDALYLAGLARFRDGRPAEALEALDRAGGGGDSPGAWQFNRGACLYALGRLAEAEAAFLAAADDPGLAAVALANAGFAALDAGATDRAAALAVRARAVASGRAVELVADLDAQLAGGAAAATAPPAVPSPAAVPAEPAAGARRWGASARVLGGWDGDALQSEIGATERGWLATTPREPSAFTGLDASAALRLPLGERMRLELGYRFGQLAYAAPAAEDRSLQQHELAAALVLSPRTALTLALAAEGQLALAGLSAYRGEQAVGGLRASAALDEGARATTRVEAGLWRLDGLGAEFAYLDGGRLELALSQEGRWRRVALRGGYHLRVERIGATRTPLPPVPPSPVCPAGCTAEDVQPLGYLGHTAWAAAHVTLRPGLELDVGGGVEWRERLDDAHRVLTSPDGSQLDVGGRRWSEVRAFTAADLSLRLTPRLSIFLRHELLAERGEATSREGAMMRCGSMETACGGADATSRDKQVVVVGTALGW